MGARAWVRRGRVAVTAVGVILAGATLAACSGGPASNVLTLYNGQHPETTEALVTAFEHETGITVLVRNADEDTLTNQITAEGARSPADVVFTENSPPLEFLSERGFLTQVAPSTLARVPARFSSPSGEWVGVSARVSVLVYNTDLVARHELPTSVLELAQPKWRGKLALAPGETDFQPIVTSVERRYGEAAALRWLEGLKANAGNHLYPDNETVTAMVNSGQAAIGIINQYYWYRLAAENGAAGTHSAIAFFEPHDPGYVVDVSGAGILRSSPHRAEAQRFLAFLVSDQGQRIIAHSESFEYPLVPGVAPPGGQRPLDQLQPTSISVADLGDGSTAVALLQKAQLL
ncbi:MAG TPA: extracellular solute-binding protein [Acidimicrobiales bacterium]|nr:extracellular solute-binding protein [Acidimicrobiales bacterium]